MFLCDVCNLKHNNTHTCKFSKQLKKQAQAEELTLAPLLSISAASSYSGFIFLQCPHPERIKSHIREG